MDGQGNTPGTVKNPKSLRVIVNGTDLDFAHLRANEELTFWVLESMFSTRAMARQCVNACRRRVSDSARLSNVCGTQGNSNPRDLWHWQVGVSRGSWRQGYPGSPR